MELTRATTWRWLVLAGAGLAMMVVVAAACGGDDQDTPVAASPTPAVAAAKIQVVDPWVRETTNDVTAAYMTLKNTGEADRLLSAATSISTKVEVHETVMQGGMMQMQPVASPLVVPANGQLELKQGGYHIMIMNVAAPLTEGQQVKLTLTFEKAGKVEVTAPVKKAPGTPMAGAAAPGAMATTTPMGR